MIRTIKKVYQAQAVIEGAGVHLKRVFGNFQVPEFDPFLLLDDFHSDNPGDYMAGFPWHPHRGIETVTYMDQGEVEHGDSLGNKGVIGPGDVQWMTAGSGIIHQEMPKESKDLFGGLQLWVNLPARSKMIAPRYQDIKDSHIPRVTPEEGVVIKVISGTAFGVSGPVQDITVDISYFDITLEPGAAFTYKVEEDYTCFAYVTGGSGYFDAEKEQLILPEQAVLYNKGGEVTVCAPDEGVQFVFLTGKPLGEPVAWQGPVVMNTDEELVTAFEEYRKGTFIKKA